MQKIGEITKTADKQGEFTNGSVAEGIEPTELDCQWFNTVQRELIAVLAAAGIKTIPENDAQLVEAIKTLLKKGDDEVRKAVYPKEEADKRFLPATTRIPDAWTKTEANKRFQPRGDYQPAGYAYSKKESDKRYLPVSTKIPDAYSKKESDEKYRDIDKKIPDAWSKTESDKRYMKAEDKTDLSEYYSKKDIEKTFLKNTLVTNQSHRTSPVGSVGMFLYCGELATTAGSSVSGAMLKPACIVFKNQAIDPMVYSGGDPGGMPGTWRALGQIAKDCVCLFARVA